MFSMPKEQQIKALPAHYYIFFNFLHHLSFKYRHSAIANGAILVCNRCCIMINKEDRFLFKLVFAQMLHGRVIADGEHTDIAEEADSCCVVIHHGKSCMPDPSSL